MRNINGGSEARFMALLTMPLEEAPYYEGAYTIGATEPDGHWNIPDPGVFERADAGIGRPFDWEFRSLPELCASRLPGMVLFGNSFSDLYWAARPAALLLFHPPRREPDSRFKLFYDTMPADTKYFILAILRAVAVARSGIVQAIASQRTRSDGRIARHGIHRKGFRLADPCPAVISRICRFLSGRTVGADALSDLRQKHRSAGRRTARRKSVSTAATY